jgi:hypothetical protein
MCFDPVVPFRFTIGGLNFAISVADSGPVENVAKKCPFDFNPGIEGKAVWADPRAPEFRPSAKSHRGKTYQVVPRLDLIMEVPETLRKYGIRFTVHNQDFSRKDLLRRHQFAHCQGLPDPGGQGETTELPKGRGRQSSPPR